MIPAVIAVLIALNTFSPAVGTYAFTQDSRGLIRMDTRNGTMERCVVEEGALKCERLK